MALYQDRDFIDAADEADARQAARRVFFVGMSVVLFLGLGLVLLLLYGQILTDSGVVELTSPPTITIPKAEALITSPVQAPNTP